MNFVELARTLQPFMSPLGETYIQVSSPDSSAVEQIELNDPLARCIVKSLLSQYLQRGHPTEKETRTALDVIIGEAFTRPRQEAQLSVTRRIQREPLAQVVLAIGRDLGDVSKTPADLLSLLTRTAERMGVVTGDPKWPRSEDSLGKQLIRIAPLLAAAGVPPSCPAMFHLPSV